MRKAIVSVSALFAGLTLSGIAASAPLTDPNDPRSWQGATVETFRALYGYPTRQAVIDDQLLDDGVFPTCINLATFPGPGAAPCGAFQACMNHATLITNPINAPVQGCSGYSYDPGSWGYTCGNADFATYAARGSCLDMWWLQDGGVNDIPGGNVWDLGGPSNQVAVFPIIDHGPLPHEAIEYTVYLSNNPAATSAGVDGNTHWVMANIDRVYLEGWHNGWIADGFTTVWRLPGGQTFRYVNVVSGGPTALISDGDDEIDTVLGLTFEGEPVCPASGDADGDGVCDDTDNCPAVSNPLQEDADGNGIGDACDEVCVTIQRGTYGSVQDTFLTVQYPGQTGGSSEQLTTGTSSTGDKITLVHYDLSFIPAAATVTSATFSIFYTYKTGATSTVDVHLASAAWSEATATYANYGGHDSLIEGSFVAEMNDFGFRSVDVQGAVQDWVDGMPNYGLALTEPFNASKTSYRSSEYAGSVPDRPKLTVCYVP